MGKSLFGNPEDVAREDDEFENRLIDVDTMFDDDFDSIPVESLGQFRVLDER